MSRVIVEGMGGWRHSAPARGHLLSAPAARPSLMNPKPRYVSSAARAAAAAGCDATAFMRWCGRTHAFSLHGGSRRRVAPLTGVTTSDLNQKIFPCLSTNHLGGDHNNTAAISSRRGGSGSVGGSEGRHPDTRANSSKSPSPHAICRACLHPTLPPVPSRACQPPPIMYIHTPPAPGLDVLPCSKSENAQRAGAQSARVVARMRAQAHMAPACAALDPGHACCAQQQCMRLVPSCLLRTLLHQPS